MSSTETTIKWYFQCSLLKITKDIKQIIVFLKHFIQSESRQV